MDVRLSVKASFGLRPCTSIGTHRDAEGFLQTCELYSKQGSYSGAYQREYWGSGCSSWIMYGT